MPAKPKSHPSINLEIGKGLAAIRKNQGISQIELATRVKITQQQLSHYERGRIHITAEMIVRLANALGITTDKILNPQNTKNIDHSLSLRFTRRIREISKLSEPKRKAVLQILDELIRANS